MSEILHENSTKVEFKEHIPRKMKIAFGSIGAGVTILSGIGLGSAITFFYNVKLGLSEDFTALAWIIFGVWNAINDPIFGIMEERTKTSIGRRIPYIRYGAPLFALTFIFCWFPVFTSSQQALFWNLLLVLFLFDSTFTMIGLITYTLPAEMCLTQEARASFSIYNIILGAVGMLVSMGLPLVLLTGDGTNLNPLFKPAMIIVAIISMTIMIIGSFFITENKYAMHEPVYGFFESIFTSFKNKAFIIFEANNFFYQIAWTILTSMLTYYVNFVLELSGLMASLPLFAIFAMVFIFIIPSGKLIAKYHLRKVYMWGLIFASVGFVFLFFIGDNILLSFLCLGFIGIGFAPITLTTSPLMHDVIDYDEVLTGKRRETTYAGVNALVTKPSISIANALFLMIINTFGFNKERQAQSKSGELGILIAFCIVPLVTLLLSAIIIKFFPLDGPDWQQQKLKLNEVHQQKEKEFLENLQKTHSNEF